MKDVCRPLRFGVVAPAKAGAESCVRTGVPAFAGMT